MFTKLLSGNLNDLNPVARANWEKNEELNKKSKADFHALFDAPIFTEARAIKAAGIINKE